VDIRRRCGGRRGVGGVEYERSRFLFFWGGVSVGVCFIFFCVCVGVGERARFLSFWGGVSVGFFIFFCVGVGVGERSRFLFFWGGVSVGFFIFFCVGVGVGERSRFFFFWVGVGDIGLVGLGARVFFFFFVVVFFVVGVLARARFFLGSGALLGAVISGIKAGGETAGDDRSCGTANASGSVLNESILSLTRSAGLTFFSSLIGVCIGVLTGVLSGVHRGVLTGVRGVNTGECTGEDSFFICRAAHTGKVDLS
jgi:hypothetical protein